MTPSPGPELANPRFLRAKTSFQPNVDRHQGKSFCPLITVSFKKHKKPPDPCFKNRTVIRQ
jgi:hypothetical protein